MLSCSYDIIIITETWLCDGVLNSELCNYRYDVFRLDRDKVLTGKADGGGVMILALRSLCAIQRSEWSRAGTECLFVTIPSRSLRESPQDLHIAVAYAPPGRQLALYIDNIISCLSMACKAASEAYFLVAGDFNLPCIKWTKDGPLHMRQGSVEIQEAAYRLTDELNLLGLQQHNTTLNASGNTLDLVYSNFSLDIHRSIAPLLKEDVYHPTLDISVSDIFAIPLTEAKIRKYCFRKGDYDSICSYLDSINWEETFQGQAVDEDVALFYDIVNKTIAKFVPLKCSTNRFHYPTWYSRALINIVKEKAKAHARWKRFHNPRDYEEFSFLRKRHKRIERECYLNYVDNTQSSIKTDPKRFWAYVKSRRKGSSYPRSLELNGTLYSDGPGICAGFNTFFNSVFQRPANSYPLQSLAPPFCDDGSVICSTIISPSNVLKFLKRLNINGGAGSDGIPSYFVVRCAKSLCFPLSLIFTKSISIGSFPSKWKEAHILPIHKKGSKTKIENYRPISILNVFSKVFEKSVNEVIYPILSRGIPPQQHGFYKGRSTTTNLVEFLNFVLRRMDKRKQVDVIYTDFEKAFDRVDHVILLRKLYRLGLRGDLFRWVTSYISMRQQAVVVGGHKSDFISIPSGVPQGSILAPLLYGVYLYDIYTVFQSSRFLLYADDKKIFSSISTVADCLAIQQDLDRLAEFYKINRIAVNVSKCNQFLLHVVLSLLILNTTSAGNRYYGLILLVTWV